MMKTGEMANDVGCIIMGEEAVEIGLIDEIGGIREALSCLYEMIEKTKEKNKDATCDRNQTQKQNDN